MIDAYTDWYITDFTSYALYAQARVGDDGAEWGGGEQTLGNQNGQTITYQAWDSDPYDGISMEPIGFELHLRAGGGTGAITWKIGDSQILTYDAPSFDHITEVLMQSAVGIQGAAFEFSDVKLSFRQDGQQTELIQFEELSADTTQGGEVQERLAFVTPTSSTNDEVIVTGSLRLTTNEGVYAWGQDIFGKIMVQTA